MAVVPSSAQAESLAEALASAYQNNPDIASALLSVKSSAEDIALRKAGLRPTIGASIDSTYNWSVTEDGYNDSTNVTGGLSYNQTLFDNFRTDAEIEQARALADLSEHALRNEEQNVLLSVVESYMNVIRDTQLIELRQDNVDFYQAQANSANDRLEVGEGTRIEVSQSQARLAQGRAAYQAAVSSLATSRASYQRWVGSPPQNLSIAHEFDNLIPGSLDAAIASAEERHPAILSARAAIRAAEAGSDAAEAAFGPTLDMIGSLCAIGCFGSTPNPPNGVSGSVRFSLSIPIYAGGALGASVRKANIQQVKSEVDAMSSYDQVRQAVISSWSALQNATAQITSARAAVSAGEEVVSGVIQERDLGQSTTLDVLDAQAELTSARELLIEARTSQVIATFTLIAAMGRLSPVDLALPVTVDTGEGYVAKVEDVWLELRSID
ncbi:TolC family outer membrane protein [Devosia pacifica]|nr:TolC family outer membrane protein [Devosia pacifica]